MSSTSSALRLPSVTHNATSSRVARIRAGKSGTSVVVVIEVFFKLLCGVACKDGDLKLHGLDQSKYFEQRALRVFIGDLYEVLLKTARRICADRSFLARLD